MEIVTSINVYSVQLVISLPHNLDPRIVAADPHRFTGRY